MTKHLLSPRMLQKLELFAIILISLAIALLLLWPIAKLMRLM